MFLVVPLVAAILDLGRPSVLLTLSGVAALHLAGETFLDRVGRPLSHTRSVQVVLATWAGGLAMLGAAGWAPSVFVYHFEPVVVVAVVAGCFIGLVSPPATAVLWGVAATAAVAMGASMAGPLTAEVGVGAASIAAGMLPGAIVGQGLERSIARQRRTLTFEP
jgi:hypothetical protein